jgi:integrase
MKLIKSEKTGIYSVQYRTASGKRRTTSLQTKIKKEASFIAKDIEQAELLAKRNLLTKDIISTMVNDRTISFQDCVNEWYNFSKVRSRSSNTIYTQSTLLSNFKAFAKISKLTELEPSMISDWVNEVGSMNANSRNQRLAAMRSFCGYAVANCYITRDPSYGIKVDLSKLDHQLKEKNIRVPFTKQELKEMLASDPPYFMKQAIVLGWWTGLRIVDISKLEWASISDTHLTVWTEKQDKRVNLPLDNPLIGGGEIRDVLKEVPYEDKKYCFPEWAELADDPKRRSRFSVYFKRFLERIGVEGKSFHCFRHSFVTRIKTESYDSSLEKIAEWVGHSRTETTKGYLHDAS